MPQPGLGLNGWVGWGPESTWGTLVSRTKYGELAGAESMALRTNPTKPRSWRGLTPRRVFEGKRFTEGDIPFELHYAGFEQWLKQLFGAVNTSGPISSLYTHAFTLATALQAGMSLEVCRDVPSGNSFLYEGCKVGALKFNGDIDQILMMTASVIG